MNHIRQPDKSKSVKELLEQFHDYEIMFKQEDLEIYYIPMHNSETDLRHLSAIYQMGYTKLQHKFLIIDGYGYFTEDQQQYIQNFANIAFTNVTNHVYAIWRNE